MTITINVCRAFRNGQLPCKHYFLVLLQNALPWPSTAFDYFKWDGDNIAPQFPAASAPELTTSPSTTIVEPLVTEPAAMPLEPAELPSYEGSLSPSGRLSPQSPPNLDQTYRKVISKILASNSKFRDDLWTLSYAKNQVSQADLDAIMDVAATLTHSQQVISSMLSVSLPNFQATTLTEASTPSASNVRRIVKPSARTPSLKSRPTGPRLSAILESALIQSQTQSGLSTQASVASGSATSEVVPTTTAEETGDTETTTMTSATNLSTLSNNNPNRNASVNDIISNNNNTSIIISNNGHVSSNGNNNNTTNSTASICNECSQRSQLLR
eukprot:m.138032 g.138032  ORF g.138032 m.138032 type:complete len:327 (+) comp52514_c0_seq1:461-1441(+)